MEKKKKKKSADLIKQAEQIAARAWEDEGKFKCPYDHELAGIMLRLGEIGQSCSACSKEHSLSARIYREVKLVLAVWRTLYDLEEENDEDGGKL